MDDVCKSYRKLWKRRERCRRLYEKDENLSEDEKSRRDEDLLRRLPDRDYPFCVVDKSLTRTSFGDASAKLINLMKKQTGERRADSTWIDFPCEDSMSL